MRLHREVVLACLWLGACANASSDEAADEPSPTAADAAMPALTYDLPAGWEDAVLIPGLVQTPCGGSALGNGPKDTLRANIEGSQVAIAYDHAHFRCLQDVEAFAKRADHMLEVLVQPIDMHPRSVAKCDCLYDISMQLDVEPGALDVTLYRRWDELTHPSEPVSIGSVSLEVP